MFISPLFFCSTKSMDIEYVRNFLDFRRILLLKSLWNRNFFEFRDKGLYGCMMVVAADGWKWGRFCACYSLAPCLRSSSATTLLPYFSLQRSDCTKHSASLER